MSITKEQFTNLEIGNTIEFKSPSRYGTRKVTRKVVGFIMMWGHRSMTHVKVRYAGSPCFYVRAHEIIRVL